MANNSSDVTISNFMATGYNGDVTANNNGFSIAGQIGCDSSKNITSFNGIASKNGIQVCRFTSYAQPSASGEAPVLMYNLTEIRDITLASQALVAIGAAETDIQAEVKKVEG